MGISHVPVASKALMRTSLKPSAALASQGLIRTHIYNGQTRNFKMGLWSTWEDRDLERESRRRHRARMVKFITSMNKSISWDRHSPNPHKYVGLKSFTCSSWRAQEGKTEQHWYVDENGKICRRNTTENGKVNQEVERNSSDRLWKYENRKSIFGSTQPGPFSSPWSTRFTTENYSQPPHSSGASKSGDSASKKDYYKGPQSSYYEAESEIDPITNRRVVKNPSSRPKKPTNESTDIPVKIFQGYRSQFQNFAPPETARKEEFAVEQGLKAYDEKVDYEGHKLYDPAETRIDYSDPIQGGLKAYDEKVATKPLESNPVQENQSTEQHDPKGILKERENFKTDLDPVEEAIQEYETHEEHPEISQQIRDQHLQARQNLKLHSERLVAADGQHPQPHQPDHLFESIQKYTTDPPKIDIESTTSDPMQEGLEAYDNKADYDPKHLVDLPVKHTDYPGRAEIENSNWNPESSARENIDYIEYPGFRKRHIDSDAVPESELGVRTRKELEAEFERGSLLSPSEEAAMVEKVKNTPKLIQDLKVETSELRNHVAHVRGRIDAKIAEVEAGWQTPNDTKKMTGNFVQDFPEEFENSWSPSESGSGGLISKTRSERQIESDVQDAERSYVEGIASKEAFARDPNTPRLETALDRTSSGKSNSEDTPSVPLKKRNDKELVREVRKIYEDAYGTIDSKHRQVNNTTSTSQLTQTDTVEKSIPTLYKILAYDPTMQSVSIAETTSVVPDSASPLTPAEVLLRLSNPAKFFPHFQPLQSQGFEIVSGSGDVLVFRKVRSGAPTAVAGEISPAQNRMRNTNPIDGMSLPTAATGDFASPTGFVNHDINRGSDPPFKSNIDVRREEPVFSGKKNWQDDSEGRKTKSLSKRILIGAAWVAACSYAVGVVADFFKTGGMDGLGLQGF